MNISIQGKQVDIGEALCRHIKERVDHICEKYFTAPLEAHVTISREGSDFRADISVHIHRGVHVHGHQRDATAYPAFDGAAEHVDKRLRRYKRRLNNHSRRAEAEKFAAQHYILAAEPEHEETPETADAPVIVAEMAAEVETMTVSDAVMRMDLANVPVFVFRNDAHGRINIVYRRDDGHIGWVDPAEHAS